MSLILCRQEPVTVPLYIEDLGIHIYSSQELCYVIYNNPLLVLEGFIDKRLTEFLRSELRMPFLAERVEKWMDSHGATEEILYSGDFRGKVWNNIAACYAKLFCYQKAMHAYENAWNAKPEAEYVKRMYFLTILNPELSLKDKFREMIGEDDKEVWNKEVEAAREESEKAPETLKLAAVFEKDPAGRIAAAGDILNQWKMEYRRML